MLAVRRQHPIFATGTIEVLPADNPSILAFMRTATDPAGDERAVLCVNNLSRFAQSAELSLARWSGSVPVELIGRALFPPIGPDAYHVMLGAHGFYWLDLEERR
jgi:maltose alpha-D-glucosyltransferase/alpha-amylase